MAIELSEQALGEIQRILKSQRKETWGVRVGVKGGGCSGLEYTMDFCEQPADHDKVNEIEGVKVFVDPKSYLYLNGMILDFSTALMGGGFKFMNPNAAQTCSCGQSFGV